MGPRSDTPALRARVSWLLVALYAGVVAIAGWLRLTHLGFAPSTPWARPDEEIFAAVGLGLFSDSDPRVGQTGWPELFFWAHHLVERLIDARLTATLGAEPHLGCLFVLDPARFLVPARLMSALLGWASVPLVMRLGFLVAPKRSTRIDRHAIALAAGSLYAVNVLATRDAHFAVSDTALIFFLLWMLVAVARGDKRGRAIDFLSSGVALGLAISTKWTGLAFAAVPVLLLALRVRRHGITLSPFAPERRAAFGNGLALVLGLLGTALAFGLTSPTAITEPSVYWHGLFTHAMRYDPNNLQGFSYRADAPMTYGLVQHALVSFPFAMGWPLTLVGLGACVHALALGARRGERVLGLLGFFALFFWAVVVGRTTMNFARYSLPAHPVIAVLVAVSLHALATRLAPRLAPLLGRAARGRRLAPEAALASLVLALGAEPTLRSIDYVRILGLTDTRELARAWLLEHAAGVPVETLGGYGRLYAVERRLADRCEALLPEGLARDVPLLDFRGDQSLATSASRASWRETANAALYPVLFRGTPPPSLRSRFVVVSRAYLPCDQETVRYDGTDPPADCYVERARFSPGELACDAQFDEQDHFYAPLWGYAGLEHLGPSIRIYENVCLGGARPR